MFADQHLQLALDDDIAFLALVGGQLDIAILRLSAVCGLNVERLRDAVAEGSSQVVVYHAVGFLNALAFTLAGHREGLQLRAGALNDIGYIHAEGQGAAIDKRKR